MSTLDRDLVRAVQRRVLVIDDGDFGNRTLAAVARALGVVPQTPEVAPVAISAPRPNPTLREDFARLATVLILEFEGLDQPGNWPKGSSGITIGRGYDLGYTGKAEFQRDWSPHLTPGQITRLSRAIGMTGAAAERMESEYRDIQITANAADQVFATATLPKYGAAAHRTFPGLENLHVKIRAALTSLVFNRGTSLDPHDPRRREMITVATLVDSLAHLSAGLHADSYAKLVAEIATQIRAMKRLWKGKNLDGLLRRRDAEAAMVMESLEDLPNVPKPA